MHSREIVVPIRVVRYPRKARPPWVAGLSSLLLTPTPDEWEGCQCLFKEKGMRTFADWLCYYNNHDVAPSLEALERMRSFYTEKGIDILKDAVSIPGVNLHYLL